MKPAVDTAFVFSYKLNHALFNIPGKIYLRLVVSAPSNKNHLQEVVHQSGDSEEEVKGHIFTTNILDVSTKTIDVYHTFSKDNFVTFYLPKGLCHDEIGKAVTLRLEVYEQTKNAKIAESSFLVYPREKNISEAATSDEIYRHSGELLLTKNLGEESIIILAGKLKYEASLRQQDTPSPIPSTPSPQPSPTVIPTPTDIPTPEPAPLPVEKVVTPEPEPAGEPDPEPVPKQPTPPPPPTVVTSNPPKRREPSHHQPSGIVALANQEEIVVVVHAASGLPVLPDNSTPCPFVLGKVDAGPGSKGQGSPLMTAWQSTHSTVDPTSSPLWEAVLCCRISAADREPTRSDVLRLRIVDKPSKTEIVGYKIPLSLLQPFHHYHLDLVQAVPLSQNVVHLYVTLYRKLSSLPDCGDFSFYGLEVRLLSLDQRLSEALGPLVVVTKIVPDYQNYRDAFREHSDLLSLEPLSVEFPVPHPSSFLTSNRGKHQGYAQLWLSDFSNVSQSSWDHSFVFCDEREMASMFVSTAAVVVELYDINSAFDGRVWHPHRPIGYAVVLLDNRVYNALTNDRGRMGVRIPNIPLQACVLPSTGKKTHSLSLVLRLLTSRVPTSLPSVSNLDVLPTVDGFNSPEISPSKDLPPVEHTWGVLNPEPAASPPTTPLPQPLYDVVIVNARKLPPLNDDDLPSRDALQNLFDSNPQERLVQPGDKPTSTKGLIPTRLPPQSDKPTSKPAHSPSGQNDQALMNLLDSQQREIDSYRQAMKRMGEEVVQLQDALSRLEVDNSRLRQQANAYEDTTRAMVTDVKLEGMSKAELLDKYVTLKRSLSKQVTETANYREKLFHAQNDLIKHNDREKQYLDEQGSHASQGRLLQERQDRVKKLELACREQEKALEKMDRALKRKLASEQGQGVRFKEGTDSAENAALSAENARLKAEVEHLKAISTSDSRGGSSDEAEKLKMQFMLERTESRVSSLERELLEKAREWGKEKASISLRSDDRQRQRSLPPLPYYDRGKPSHDFKDLYTDRSYGNRRPRLGYVSPTRLSPLY